MRQEAVQVKKCFSARSSSSEGFPSCLGKQGQLHYSLLERCNDSLRGALRVRTKSASPGGMEHHIAMSPGRLSVWVMQGVEGQRASQQVLAAEARQAGGMQDNRLLQVALQQQSGQGAEQRVVTDDQVLVSTIGIQ